MIWASIWGGAPLKSECCLTYCLIFVLASISSSVILKGERSLLRQLWNLLTAFTIALGFKFKRLPLEPYGAQPRGRVCKHTSCLSYCWDPIPVKSNTRKGGFTLAHVLGSAHGRREVVTVGMWGSPSPCVHSQEAERDERSACSLLFSLGPLSVGWCCPQFVWYSHVI